MQKHEVIKLLGILSAAYPKFPEVDDLMVEVWYRSLADIPYKLAEVAIQKLILENVFPPSIAEVRNAVVSIAAPKVPTAAEAWGEVERALRLYGYYREREAIESMSDITAKTVKYIGWANICLSEELSVIRGQFLKMYEQMTRREQSEYLLPEGLKRSIEALNERYEGMRVLKGGKEGA